LAAEVSERENAAAERRSWREGGAVKQEVESTELGLQRRSKRCDLLIAADVARQDERVVQLCCQLANVFFQSRAGVGEGEASPACLRGLSDGPRDRTFVGDTDDEAELA
jgi:hypothetical protein